jgi:hypothetical protein
MRLPFTRQPYLWLVITAFLFMTSTARDAHAQLSVSVSGNNIVTYVGGWTGNGFNCESSSVDFPISFASGCSYVSWDLR